MTPSFVRSAALAVTLAFGVGLMGFTGGFGVSAQTPGPWKVLFDGKDLSQWTVPAGRGRQGAPPPAADAPLGWKIQDGAVVGGLQQPGDRSGGLTTNDKYFDFELELEFDINELAGNCTEQLGEKPNAAGQMQKEQNMSEPSCLANSGINWRSGYQLNIGRRDAGEYIGLVIHRTDPKAIRGNILWLSHGDKDHPGLRKKSGWNTLRVSVKGDHMQTWMNGTKIVDVNDKSTIEAEAGWRVPQPISFQMPYTPGGIVKFRNIRVRTL